MAGRRSRFRARGAWNVRVALGLALVAGFAWCAGLVWFVGQVPRQAAPIEAPVEAIVVLTGGVGRLEEGLDLLRRNPGARLFVSGVYHGIDVAELLRVEREIPDALGCCVELGHDAEDTRGNARESAAWVQAHGIARIRLVTGNYHMPRSLFEFRRAMPDVVVEPHPIIAKRVRLDGWWYRPGTAALLASEYTKYLVARAFAPAS